MSMSAAKDAKTEGLPKSATITVEAGHPCPEGWVEVSPDNGQVIFENKDSVDYRLRFWKPGSEPKSGIDILLSARGSTTILIKLNDEFLYELLDRIGDRVAAGGPNGVRN
jgi:hypothetical protein